MSYRQHAPMAGGQLCREMRLNKSQAWYTGIYASSPGPIRRRHDSDHLLDDGRKPAKLRWQFAKVGPGSAVILSAKTSVAGGSVGDTRGERRKEISAESASMPEWLLAWKISKWKVDSCPSALPLQARLLASSTCRQRTPPDASSSYRSESSQSAPTNDFRHDNAR